MILELNPFKWGRKAAASVSVASERSFRRPEIARVFSVPVAQIGTIKGVSDSAVQVWPDGMVFRPAVDVPAKAEESVMSFTSVLKLIAKDFAKGLKWAVTYAIPVEQLVTLLFPAAAPVVAELGSATTLIQNAVLLVEQKYAASGAANGTGAEKLAEVLTLTEDAVTSLLAKANITADTGYITSLVNAVVAILNVQQTTEAAA